MPTPSGLTEVLLAIGITFVALHLDFLGSLLFTLFLLRTTPLLGIQMAGVFAYAKTIDVGRKL